jgi:hypothetical protein
MVGWKQIGVEEVLGDDDLVTDHVHTRREHRVHGEPAHIACELVRDRALVDVNVAQTL